MSEKIELEKLKKQNKQLKDEIKYLKRLTGSRRFRAAEVAASMFNGVFPVGTSRRKIVKVAGKYATKIQKTRQTMILQKNQQKLRQLTAKHDKVIVINGIGWGTQLKQRPHHLAMEFSRKGYFVVYLDLGDYFSMFKVIEKNIVIVNSFEMLGGLEKIKNLYFMTPNNMPVTFEQLARVRDMGFGIIYDCLDELHEDISGDLSKQFEVYERIAELKPVLLVATAKKLYDQLENRFPGANTLLAQNAVNVEHFDFTKQDHNDKPTDLRKILAKKAPIVGFYGALASWTDFKLLNNIAKNCPKYEFVYIGIDYNGALSALKKQDNVHYLGPKNYDDLPRYSRWFNCAIVPFKQGEIAKSTSPVKLFEYMAMGLPTVCTRDLKECEGYEYVYMSENDTEFEKNIKKAIKDHKDKKKRLALLNAAKKNTWEQKVKDIDKLLPRT